MHEPFVDRDEVCGSGPAGDKGHLVNRINITAYRSQLKWEMAIGRSSGDPAYLEL